MELLSNQAPVLAIDGGGTTCRALLFDQSGRILSYTQEGPVNYHSVGAVTAEKTMIRLLQSIACTPLSVECAVFGLAGLDTRKDKDCLTAIVIAALQAAGIKTKQLLLENDGMTTLIGATGGEDGLLVIAGTGSIACGIASDGRRVRVGGWGSLAGDEGSGYWIGMSAVRHVLRAFDGREKPSGICEAILQENGMADVEELVNWIYGFDFSIDSVAAIAPVVCRLAESGDEQARTIIAAALNELSQMATAVIKQLGAQKSKLHTVLAGGVLQRNSLLREQLKNYIQQIAPQAFFVPPVYPPIIGGALLGLRASGVTSPDSLRRIAADLAEQLRQP